jgi:hypothetical protein
MKPDQHKQKKNAAYKKKHGIPSDKEIDKQPNGKDIMPGSIRRGDKDSSKGSEMEYNSRGQQMFPKGRSNGQLNISSAASRPSNELVRSCIEVDCELC